MLIHYGKFLVYSILELVSAIINLCFAILALRSTLSLGINWLGWLEAKRVTKELNSRSLDKRKKLDQADKDMNYVKETFDGTDMEWRG